MSSYRSIPLFLCLLGWAQAMALGGWLEEIQEELETACYLTVASILLDVLERHPDNREAANILSQLDRKASARLALPSLTFIQKDYFEGYQAWRSEAFDKARGCWTKYLEKRRRQEFFKPDAQFSEVSFFYDLSEEEGAPQKDVSQFETRGEKRNTPLKKNSPKNNEFKKQKKISPSLTINQLSKEAEQARQNGQLEQALRFYQLANQLQPSEDIQKQMEEIEKELR